MGVEVGFSRVDSERTITLPCVSLRSYGVQLRNTVELLAAPGSAEGRETEEQMQDNKHRRRHQHGLPDED
jgi:hypothetical protein